MTTRIIRWAWWGRTSTEDLQDPTLSLPRQLNTSKTALPPGAVIVAHFYDIESGRKDLDQRGRGTAHEQFAIPIPRDGGIQDLLAEATSPTRRFDGVICESIDRIARRTYYGTKIEHELDHAGVLLVAADEPMQHGRKRATAILTRRVKQGVAEWYVLETLEKSWDGFMEHTKQGYNVGRPPYGYIADRIPHPVPARREQGKTKSRLVPDPVRAAVVREIFDLYLTTGMGLDLIRDKLNADPVAYPPPVPPDPRRSLGAWSSSSIRDILHNPKYTGFMVWNRRARKGGSNRTNPESDWVWSPVPMHEPLVSMNEFRAVQGKAAANEGSRRTRPDEQARAQRAIYLYRGLVRCGICGLRMTGTIRRNATGRYYFCYPNKHRRAEIPTEHPRTVYLPEPTLHQTVTGWLATAILGPDRADYWRDALAPANGAKATADQDARARRLAEIDTTIADLTRRLHRQILNLEDEHLSAAARHQIADRIGELEADIATHRAMADQLRGHDEPEAHDPDEIAAALTRLPQLAGELGDMPEPALRELYESLDLQLRYHPDDRCVDIQVTLADGTSHDRLVPPAGPALHGNRPRPATAPT